MTHKLMICRYNLTGTPVTTQQLRALSPAINQLLVNVSTRLGSYNASGTINILVRGGCSDRTFKSTSRPQFLLDGDYRGFAVNLYLFEEC